MSIERARELLERADSIGRMQPQPGDGAGVDSWTNRAVLQLHMRAFVEAADVANSATRKETEPPLNLAALAEGLDHVAGEIKQALGEAPPPLHADTAADAMARGLIRSQLAFHLGQLEGMAIGIRAHLPHSDAVVVGYGGSD